MNMLFCQNHPYLILTEKGMEHIRMSEVKPPLFEKALNTVKNEVDAEIDLGILVPIPKDMAGGYTHERHKKNFFILQKAGNLYQITGEEKYAVYVRDMFLAYAEMYPTLGLHPSMKSYATGKIFWQCLNDANWLVYSSQAYDCIYDFLTKEERKNLENNLFRPIADFLSKENPKFFNRIHNHSTWGNAAVGMIGLVMNDEELVQRALYGLKSDTIDDGMKDNDGGFIQTEGVNKAGFLAQLDFSFSPDGYFTEGPYYLRYAMTPFLLFSKALANNRPDLKIYSYRDGILKKAVFALLNLTDSQGQFFPINDALKGMSWKSREVVTAINIAYADFGNDPMLLSIAESQNEVMLNQAGFKVADDISKNIAIAYKQQAIVYRDGANGNKGGVAILRKSTPKDGEICTVMKYSAHGMGHGHFDKLSYSLYNELGEIIQDYGAARWVNIDQKGGGRYLPENKSFAKQSIAHNTLIVNEQSHYEGSVKKGEANHPEFYFFDTTQVRVQAVSAKEKHAYPHVEMHRTLLLMDRKNFTNPLLIDVFKIQSDKENQYDLPIWFQGHLLSNSFDLISEINQLRPLGNLNGYQHIWKEASGNANSNNAQITWLNNGIFFTLTAFVSEKDDLIFGRSGANDPKFNLRHDPCFIIRKTQDKDALFISIIESHGTYNPVSEIPLNPFSTIDNISLVHDSEAYTIFTIRAKDDQLWTIQIANKDPDKMAIHEMIIKNKNYKWQGPIKINNKTI